MSKAFDHLLPVFRPYARLPAQDRIGWIRQDRWINYTRADQILTRLAALLDYPPRDRMPCLLLFGATGMGKTRLVEKFLRDHRSRFDEITGLTRLPVACIQMPPSPKERDFYEELLVGLQTVLPAGLNGTTLPSLRASAGPAIGGAYAGHRRDPFDAGGDLPRTAYLSELAAYFGQ